MRKVNMFLVIGMLASFLLHAVTGSLKLMGSDAGAMKTAAWACVGFICAHVVVTAVLTAQTLKARRLSGAGYFKNNLMFWARRISGIAIVIPLLMHILVFQSNSSGAFRLREFTTGRLIVQIFLVAAIAAHVFTNIEPMLIGFGVKDTKAFSHDIIFVLTVVLLFAAVGFAVYWLRWAAI